MHSTPRRRPIRKISVVRDKTKLLGLKLLELLTSLFRLDRSGGAEPPRHPLSRLTASDSSQEWATNGGYSKGASNRQQPIPPALGQLLFQPTASDYEWQRVSSRRWATPAEHAMAILDLLQGPGGRTGTFTCTALKRVHTDICLEQGFEPIGWTAVGRELRKLIKDEKTYDRINREQVRVYRIPPRTLQTRVRAA